MRQEGARINVNRVAARRLHDGHAVFRNVVAEVSGRGDTVFEVVLVQGLLHADGDGFEISPCQPAVGRIAFGQDQQVLLLLGEDVVVRA